VGAAFRAPLCENWFCGSPDPTRLERGKRFILEGVRPFQRSSARSGPPPSAPTAILPICCGHIDRGVSDLGALAISACARWQIVPKRARAQLRGRPISEKALVLLEMRRGVAEYGIAPVERHSSAAPAAEGATNPRNARCGRGLLAADCPAWQTFTIADRRTHPRGLESERIISSVRTMALA
jgi:hypothetical protein